MPLRFPRQAFRVRSDITRSRSALREWLSPHTFKRFIWLQWPRPVAIVFCGLIGTLLPAAYGMVAGIREPDVHDEFSYLLGADTFAHGRLTNPPPATPEFFESPHILVVPTYNSKYPPGQALVLALGQVISGHPIWGVWLSCGFFAASLCWMLHAWTSKPWALAITIVAIAKLGVTDYWAQSYWGGMVAACAGALLFGGMRRIWRAPRVLPSLLMGLGVLLLANTRPYEGLLACLPVAAVLGCWFVRDRRTPLRTKLVSCVLPFGGVLIIGGASMTLYNRAITGHWLSTPYAVHQTQYFYTAPFVFSSVREPTRTPLAHRTGKFYRRAARKATDAAPLAAQLGANLFDRRSALLWVLAIVITAVGNRWFRFLLITVVVSVFGALFVQWWYPHYSAPVVPLVLAAMAMALRRAALHPRVVYRLRRAAPGGVALLAAFFVILSVLYHLTLYRRPGNHIPDAERIPSPLTTNVSPERALSWANTPLRSNITRQLTQHGGFHLVFVEYDDNFPLSDEWVYNSADLNASRVIFAHDLGDEKNRELIDTYAGRSVWMVKVSNKHASLAPYSIQENRHGAFDQ